MYANETKKWQKTTNTFIPAFILEHENFKRSHKQASFFGVFFLKKILLKLWAYLLICKNIVFTNQLIHCFIMNKSWFIVLSIIILSKMDTFWRQVFCVDVLSSSKDKLLRDTTEFTSPLCS